MDETINLRCFDNKVPINLEKIYSRKFIRISQKILRVANKKIKDPKEIYLLLTVTRILLERQFGFWFDGEGENQLRMIVDGEH